MIRFKLFNSIFILLQNDINLPPACGSCCNCTLLTATASGAAKGTAPVPGAVSQAVSRTVPGTIPVTSKGTAKGTAKGTTNSILTAPTPTSCGGVERLLLLLGVLANYYCFLGCWGTATASWPVLGCSWGCF